MIDDCTGSNDQDICFEVGHEIQAKRCHSTPQKWNVAKMDEEKLFLTLVSGEETLTAMAARVKQSEKSWS